MPTRQVSNGNVTVWFVTSIANPAAPTPTEINAGKNLSEAIAWNNFELGSSGSDDVDDKSIVDSGNSVSRGNPDFGATLDFFRERDLTDTTSIYAQAFTLFKNQGVAGYLVVRYGQALPTAVAAAGEYVSVYKVLTDAISDDTEGNDSVKFEVKFLPQGVIHEHTLVKTAVAVVVAPATVTISTSDPLAKLTATVSGKNVTNQCTFVSSDTTVATVSQAGVVKWVSAGTATISVSHPSATTDGTSTVTAS
jgi:hypothetical protein